ncbi:MAG: VWA-like domain-containing protein [Clostridiales bacterium]|nr:VWA-like domain-containing protein [Clostridiales bacterium]
MVQTQDVEEEIKKSEEPDCREIAGQIMVFAREQIMVSLSYLSRALFKMPLIAADTVESYGVNGRMVIYNPDHVVRDFKRENNRPVRAFLHMLLHCIYCHPFHYEEMDRECWDLAADMAVEQTIMDLGLACTKTLPDERIARILKSMKEYVPIITAEKVYRFLLDDPEKAAAYLKKAELFYRDDHLHWIIAKEEDAADRVGDTYTTDTRTAMFGCHEADSGEGDDDEYEQVDEALVGQIRDEWADISEHAKMDIETFSREQGFGAGSLLMNLKEALREKQDYGGFLKKFAVLGEEMQINDEEFDYIYYTYGLQLYEKMPLVEPLEYRENKRIRDFVIAIDTSGSCQGATVEGFLRKTYEILKSTDSYFSRVNIHIIQCDAKIQSDVKVTSDEEFDAYMEDVDLSGFGGTDFRPVFEYVDGLVERHEFSDLRGLIYFTDGRGTYPAVPPNYETAFVFLEDGFAIPTTPPWAIKLVLNGDEL